MQIVRVEIAGGGFEIVCKLIVLALLSGACTSPEAVPPSSTVRQGSRPTLPPSPKASASPGAARESGVGPTWRQQASFKASNTGFEDTFGVRLALSGDGNTFASGAPHEDSAAQGINGRQDDNSALDAGAVYVFDRKGTSWTQGAYVKGSNTEAFDEIGSSIALNRDGRIMAIGARFEDSGAKGVNGNQADNSVSDSGAVYIFVR